MQSCNDQHHKNAQHSEIFYKGYLPYPHTPTGKFTPRLQQFTTHGFTQEVNKPNAMCTEYCSKSNIEQAYQRQCYWVPQGMTLAPYTTKEWL